MRQRREQRSGGVGVQDAQRQGLCPVQRDQTAAARHQRHAVRPRGQQRLDLSVVARVVEHEQHPLARELVPPHIPPPDKGIGQKLRDDAKPDQQPRQHLGRIGRDLAGDVSIQFHEVLAVGEPEFQLVGRRVARAVLPIPAMPSMVWIDTTCPGPAAARIRCNSRSRPRNVPTSRRNAVVTIGRRGMASTPRHRDRAGAVTGNIHLLSIVAGVVVGQGIPCRVRCDISVLPSWMFDMPEPTERTGRTHGRLGVCRATAIDRSASAANSGLATGAESGRRLSASYAVGEIALHRGSNTADSTRR